MRKSTAGEATGDDGRRRDNGAITQGVRMSDVLCVSVQKNTLELNTNDVPLWLSEKIKRDLLNGKTEGQVILDRDIYAWQAKRRTGE